MAGLQKRHELHSFQLAAVAVVLGAVAALLGAALLGDSRARAPLLTRVWPSLAGVVYAPNACGMSYSYPSYAAVTLPPQECAAEPRCSVLRGAGALTHDHLNPGARLHTRCMLTPKQAAPVRRLSRRAVRSMRFTYHLVSGFRTEPQLAGVPVLFVPGSGGSYRQARLLRPATCDCHYY
jgi:hypothetical protein